LEIIKMNVERRSALVLPILLMFARAAWAQEFSPQKHRDAVRSARTYVAGLESPGECPANIEPDLERAVGVICDDQTLPFFLFVPQKALEKTDFQGQEIRKGFGVPVGYLFGHWSPVIDGQLVESDRMLHTLYQERPAGDLRFNCLALTASRKEHDGYVLHAFGTGEKPLFSVPLEKAEKGETAVLVKDLDVPGLRLKLELSFGPGRRASIPFGIIASGGQ
jgi:hypothetical protein